MTLVAVDLGGTNVRFALAGDGGLTHHASLLCQDYPALEAAFSAYLATLDTEVTAASIAPRCVCFYCQVLVEVRA